MCNILLSNVINAICTAYKISMTKSKEEKYFVALQMKKTVPFFFYFLIINVVMHAQSQSSGWLASFNTFKTGKRTSIHTDVQIRSSDKFQHIQTLLLRAGLNYRLNKQMLLTGGYAFIQNRRVINTVAGYAPEHRIWEQFILTHAISRLSVQHRFRLEHRFISKSIVVNDQFKNDGHVPAHRFRYFIRNVLPLQKTAIFSKGFFVALQNEVFLNIGNNDGVNNKVFDQNRVYTALGYRFCSKFDIDAGYMNQYIKGSGKQATNNHIIQLATYLRL